MQKSVIGILLVPAALLLVPLVAMQFTDEVGWGPLDFAFAWVLMSGVGLAYHFATRHMADFAYRIGVGVALAAAFVLIWGNLAVGLIGSEDNPANLMYFGALFIGLIGAGIVRFEARGMARAMFATAAAQAVVPVIALLIWRPGFSAGVVRVLGLNTAFVLLFLASALLFRHAAGRTQRSRTPDDGLSRAH